MKCKLFNVKILIGCINWVSKWNERGVFNVVCLVLRLCVIDRLVVCWWLWKEKKNRVEIF